MLLTRTNQAVWRWYFASPTLLFKIYTTERVRSFKTMVLKNRVLVWEVLVFEKKRIIYSAWETTVVIIIMMLMMTFMINIMFTMTPIIMFMRVIVSIDSDWVCLLSIGTVISSAAERSWWGPCLRLRDSVWVYARDDSHERDEGSHREHDGDHEHHHQHHDDDHYNASPRRIERPSFFKNKDISSQSPCFIKAIVLELLTHLVV